MTDTVQNAAGLNETKLLGPFLGYVTPRSIKIWLHFEADLPTVYVSLHEGTVGAPQTAAGAPQTAAGALKLRAEKLFTDCITIEGLRPDTRYFYRLWTDPAHSLPLDLQGLTDADLQFRTLSEDTNA
jgi:hypothetical protein